MPSAPPPEIQSTTQVLVVDDDAAVSAIVCQYLDRNGFSTSSAGSGAQLREMMNRQHVDLVLLDLGLPDEDGLQLLRHLQDHWQGPVIVVSGRGEPVERIVGLELGADDYIGKPFELRELLARVRSVLRRARPGSPRRGSEPGRDLQFDGLQWRPAVRQLLDRDGSEIELTSGEFELLQALLDRPNQVLSRDELMTCTHGRSAGPFDRAIDVQVSRLRRKIEQDNAHPRLIRSVRGAGYVLSADVVARH